MHDRDSARPTTLATCKRNEQIFNKIYNKRESRELCTYSLSVNAVHSEKQGGKTRPPGTFPQGPLGEGEEEERCGAVQQHVDQVVGEGLELGEVVVEVAVGEHRQWAVRLVAFHPRHCAAPKIVLEELPG